MTNTNRTQIADYTQTETIGFSSTFEFSTVEERDEFVSQFPKSLRVKSQMLNTSVEYADPIHGYTGDEKSEFGYPLRVDVPTARFEVEVGAISKGNSENETGIKRLRKFVAKVGRENLTESVAFKNSIPLDEFLADYI